MFRIAVLLASHNRRVTTLRCLGMMMAQLRKGDAIFLVDDGSTDGTADAVAKEFPDVRIIKGDGSLFWAKGMRKAWEAAVVERNDWDGFLWLNDDLYLWGDALAGMLTDYEKSKSVVVGACSEDATEAKSSYGAKNRMDSLMVPNGMPQLADGWFNGNCVFVPRDVYLKVGMISGEYTHARADYDYAERLKKANIPFYCSSKYVGVCHNDFDEKMRGKSLCQRIKLLWLPGYFNLHDLWLIRSRYHGIPRAILSCLHLISLVVRG